MRLRVVLIIMCLAIGLIPLGIISAILNIQIATVYLLLIFFVTLFLSFFITYFISKPLERLTRTIDNISKGNLDVTLQNSDIEEINTLTNSLNRVLASLKLAIQKVGVQKGEIFEETMKAKQQIESKYQDLLRTLNDWSWEVDNTFTFTFCTPQINNVLGYNPEEIIGTKLSDIITPRHLREIKKSIKNHSNDPQKIYHLDIPWMHKNGYNVPIHWAFVPILDESNTIKGLRGVAHDITDIQTAHTKIKKLKEQLTTYQQQKTPPAYPEQYNYYETLKRIAPNDAEPDLFDYTYLFDDNLKILDCDTAIAETLGYKKKELIGHPLETINYLDSIPGLQEKIDNCRKLGHINDKTIYKTKEGTPLFVSEDITYLPEKNLFRCHIKKDHITSSTT